MIIVQGLIWEKMKIMRKKASRLSREAEQALAHLQAQALLHHQAHQVQETDELNENKPFAIK